MNSLDNVGVPTSQSAHSRYNFIIRRLRDNNRAFKSYDCNAVVHFVKIHDTDSACQAALLAVDMHCAASAGNSEADKHSDLLA